MISKHINQTHKQKREEKSNAPRKRAAGEDEVQRAIYCSGERFNQSDKKHSFSLFDESIFNTKVKK